MGTAACSNNRVSNETLKTIVEATPTAAPAPTSVKPIPSAIHHSSTDRTVKSDPYQLAIDKADSAQNIGQYAQSQDDWKLAADLWQQAVQLLQSVPASNPNRVKAKAKLAEYQRSLANAKQQATRIGREATSPSNAVALAPGAVSRSNYNASNGSSSSTSSGSFVDSPNLAGRVFRARIKRREGGTPVIDVVFNGKQAFEMIVDTGASGTVITEEMAAALGVQVVGKAKVDTASDRNLDVPLAYIKSMSVGGATVKGVIVAIAGPALSVGLLGHDFFNNFDVTVRRDVVEFRAR